MNKVNLHIHTTASDGINSSAEVFDMAKKLGLKTIAITDHDNISGSKLLLKSVDPKEMEIISGVELTADYKNGQCHILGYNIDYETIELFVNKITESRKYNASNIVSLLKNDGYDISLEEVLAVTPNKIIGRRNIAKILGEKEYFHSEEEAIATLFQKDKKYYFETKKPPINECLNAIKQSGGVSVLAHPWTLNLSFCELTEFIIKLKGYGLNGIEVYNHNIAYHDYHKLVDLAEKLNLLITCGTDYHGHKGLTELVVKEEVDCSKILKKLRGDCVGNIK